MKKVKSKTKQIKPIIHASSIKSSVKIMGKVYTAEGETVEEALKNLKPEGAKGMSILTITKDGVTRERILGRLITQRLFGPASQMTKDIAFKQALTLF